MSLINMTLISKMNPELQKCQGESEKKLKAVCVYTIYVCGRERQGLYERDLRPVNI